MKINLSTKTPDKAGKGLITVFDGPPSYLQAHDALFDGVSPKGGKFFVTGQSDDPIIFILNYSIEGDFLGIPFFDAVTVSTGDINNDRGLTTLSPTSTWDIENFFNYRVKHYYGYSFDRGKVENNVETGNTRLLIFRF